MAYQELKQRQSVMWGNGPYQRITETIADIHEAVIAALETKTNQAGNLFVERLLVELQPNDIAMFRNMTSTNVGKELEVTIGTNIVQSFRLYTPIIDGRLEFGPLGFRLPLSHLLSSTP